MKLTEIKNSKAKKRILNAQEWDRVKETKSTEWVELREKRHDFIKKYHTQLNLADDSTTAERMAMEKVKKTIDIPVQDFIRNSQYGSANIPFQNDLFSNQTNQTAILNMINTIDKLQTTLNFTNSLYSQNTSLANTINSSYSAGIMNPYEAQALFETTALGYQGITIPIKDAFSTPITISSPYIEYEDVREFNSYISQKDILGTIRTAIIDAYVYGGGIITPIFKYKNEPILLSDLNSPLLSLYNTKLELDSLMCFDRYCTIPRMANDGLYTIKLWSSLPIELETIFGDRNNEILHWDWYSRFTLDTTSRSKFYRPDGFGVSVFARAGRAVYNYEQQIQFLNYALSQLSIIVFSSKSQDYDSGGSADHTWDSPLAGKQLENIRAGLSAMQQGMSVDRGIYVNDIEVSAINRTFAGIDSIINAMLSQASMAFGIPQDSLFGIQKSSLGNSEKKFVTPQQIQLRGAFKNAITKTLSWLIVGFLAQKNWKLRKNGVEHKITYDDFCRILNNYEIIYVDSIQTNEELLKNSGILEISKLLENRMIKASSAIKYASSIPTLAKVYNTEDIGFKEFIEAVDKLQMTGINAETQEQEAIKDINTAISKKGDKILEPKEKDKNTEFDKNQKLNYDKNNISLADLGEADDNGIVYPLSVEKRRTKKEPLSKDSKRRDHT